MKEKLQSRDLQEDLLILLVFNDEYCSILANLLEPDYFDRIYEEVVRRSINFVRTYKEAPKDSLPSLVDDLLNSDDESEARLFREVVEHLFQSQQAVQPKYTLSRLEDFVRSRHLKDAVLRSAEILNNNATTEAMDSVEGMLLEASKKRLSVFDPGTKLTDLSRSLALLDKKEVDSFRTGVKHLDSRNAGPSRGALFLFIAAAKAGKSWALANLGKMALINRQVVVHLTLEMDEAQVAMRYLQSMFGMSKRERVSDRSILELDEMGNFMGIDVRSMVPKLNLQMADVKEQLTKRIKGRGMRMEGLVIKQFPTGSLTVPSLRSYLDLLADSERIKPDLLIVDYADLMKTQGNDFRLALGNLYKELRGIAVERNLAIATASQANRSGARSRQIDAVDVAEDWSKIATSDVVITYTQSEAEKVLNLARLRVAAARSDEDKYTVVIAQHYETGQFCLDSVRLTPRYFTLVEDTSNISIDNREVEHND